jgi:hypothetical protein
LSEGYQQDAHDHESARDEFGSQAEAERAFRELVETEPTCSKLDT